MSPKEENGNELVLVSGATGYIGSWVVFELLSNGYRVRGTVRDLNNKENQVHLQRWIEAGFPLELVEASLLDAASWMAAVHGCTMVAHVASPFFIGCPESEADEKLYQPAVKGTTNVLQAAFESGTVKHVVLTSSIAAVQAGHPSPRVLENPEEQWSNLANSDPYSKSKTLAERAAWDFVEEKLAEEKRCFTLTTINPALVIGPPLSPGSATSHLLPRRLLNREIPRIPDMKFGVIDVRDVARAHRLGFEKEEAAGHRFVMQESSMSMMEMANAIRSPFLPLGYNPPTKKALYPLLWIASFFNSSVKALLPNIGKAKMEVDCSKIKSMLDMDFIPGAQSFVEHCHGCLQAGVKGFKQTTEYKAYLESPDAWKVPTL